MPIEGSAGTLDIENATLRSNAIAVLTNLVTGNDGVRESGAPALEVYGDPGPRLELVSNTAATDGTATFTRLESNVGVFSIQSGTDAATNGPITFGGFSNERMRIDADGNVGIGTTNPESLLHLSSDTGSASIVPTKLKIHTTTVASDWDNANPWGLIEFDTDDTSFAGSGPVAGIGVRSGDTTGGYPQLCFYTDNVETNDTTLGPANERMVIDHNGNVGIGTTNPLTPFHISSTNEIDTSPASSGVSQMRYGSTNSTVLFGVSSTAGHISAYETSNFSTQRDLCFNADGGNVGIGTTNPVSNLTVLGSSRFDVDVSDVNHVIVGNKYSSSDSLSLVSLGAVNICIDSNANSTGRNIDFRTHTYSNGGTLLMRIKDNGNVGIGTDNPISALDIVRGDAAESVLSVRGTSQGTGRLYVGQSSNYGGGIEYNGDNSPASTGAGADYTTLYRVENGSLIWTARNVYNANQWEFRTAINNSDDRVKENETYIRGATDTLMKIKPQLYDKKPSIESTDTKEWLCESGLIAQELYYDVPELRHLVKIPRDARDIDANISVTSADPNVDPDYSAWGKDTSAVNYIGLIPYLIKSVQEITTELPRHKTPVSNITPRNVKNFVGMIVSKSGSVELSTKSEDKACYGVISEIECDTQNNEVLVNSRGEGKIWVADITGNLEAGDFITTSNIAGYGQLQNSPNLTNFTVAKITESCDFNPTQNPVRRIKQEMSNVTVYSVSREVRVTEEEYNELAEEDRTIENRITYFDGDRQIDLGEYSNLESNTLRTETTMVFKLIHRHTSKTMREGYTPEVRQELVNVLDEHGQLQWEDDPSGATEPAYKIRYLDADGNITDEANHVYKAAFVGCTYHCG